MPHVKANGIIIRYQWDQGPGASRASDPVVLLSNSLSSDISMWDKQVEVLIEHGYRVLRHDARGHGQTDAPDKPYSIEMLGEDAIGLLDALDLNKVHFCGLSMGGMVGQYLASTHPSRLLSACLCATAAYLNVGDIWDERRALVLEQGMSAVVDATLERWFTPAAKQNISRELEAVRQGILQTPTVGYANSCLAIRDMDLREQIRQIDLPVMVIAGEKDPSTTVAAAEEIAAAIPAAKLSVIDGAQHLLNIEMAEQFNAILVNFLKTNSE